MSDFLKMMGVTVVFIVLVAIIFISGYATSERDYKDQVHELKQTLEIRECQLKNCENIQKGVPHEQ